MRNDAAMSRMVSAYTLTGRRVDFWVESKCREEK